MKRTGLSWLAPLLAGWVLLWHACLGAPVGLPEPARKSGCCAEKVQPTACCHRACCAAPATPSGDSVPSTPAPLPGQALPDWMPVLLSGFLLPPPQDPAAPALAPVAPDAGSASTPLFRRFCALLI